MLLSAQTQTRARLLSLYTCPEVSPLERRRQGGLSRGQVGARWRRVVASRFVVRATRGPTVDDRARGATSCVVTSLSELQPSAPLRVLMGVGLALCPNPPLSGGADAARDPAQQQPQQQPQR